MGILLASMPLPEFIAAPGYARKHMTAQGHEMIGPRTPQQLGPQSQFALREFPSDKVYRVEDTSFAQLSQVYPTTLREERQRLPREKEYTAGGATFLQRLRQAEKANALVESRVAAMKDDIKARSLAATQEVATDAQDFYQPTSNYNSMYGQGMLNWKASIGPYFRYADTNGDGVVDAQETASALERPNWSYVDPMELANENAKLANENRIMEDKLQASQNAWYPGRYKSQVHMQPPLDASRGTAAFISCPSTFYGPV